MSDIVRLIAFYLPQFHPIPENDAWWGKGFTEWTNVGKAKKLFRNHYQPRVPADLGYYDLRLSEVREAQAEMAREAGVEGFCYWHYWFGNKRRLLERPFNEVLASGKPDFPFCLGWANETWSGIWHGAEKTILIEQLYPGIEDYKAHFYEVLPAFLDKRYLTVDGKPIFFIYRPLQFKEVGVFIELWQKLAQENGLPGIYFVGHTYFSEDIQTILDMGYDAANVIRMHDYERSKKTLPLRMFRRIFGGLRVFDYAKASKHFIGEEEKALNCIPTVIPNWDHSPRSGKRAFILNKATPELFKEHLEAAVDKIKHKPPQHRIAFVKSWNEWAEGNYLEPDLVYGKRFLDAIRAVVGNKKDA